MEPHFLGHRSPLGSLRGYSRACWASRTVRSLRLSPEHALKWSLVALYSHATCLAPKCYLICLKWK